MSTRKLWLHNITVVFDLFSSLKSTLREKERNVSKKQKEKQIQSKKKIVE